MLSNKPDRQAVHVVRAIFGENVFDRVQGQRGRHSEKAGSDGSAPDRIPRSALLRRETVYIGDSEVDAATGRAAGMKTILVAWGFRGAEALRAGGAECIVDSTEEIMDIIRG